MLKDSKAFSGSSSNDIDRAKGSTAARSGSTCPLGAALPEAAQVEPMPDSRAVAEEGDPADLALAREIPAVSFERIDRTGRRGADPGRRRREAP